MLSITGFIGIIEVCNDHVYLNNCMYMHGYQNCLTSLPISPTTNRLRNRQVSQILQIIFLTFIRITTIISSSICYQFQVIFCSNFNYNISSRKTRLCISYQCREYIIKQSTNENHLVGIRKKLQTSPITVCYFLQVITVTQL